MLKKIHSKIKKANTIHKIFVLLAFLIVFIGISNFDFTRKSSASATDNVSGYAWSDGIGWINFNCTTDPSLCNNSNHGVNLSFPNGTGYMSGYAWSDSIGWIKFDSTLSGPSNAVIQRGAQIDTNNDISGWARACLAYVNQTACSGPTKAVTGTELGGWDGWISFNCKDANACGTSNYKVTYDPTQNVQEFSGFAWGGGAPGGGMFVGWISFNHNDIPSIPSNYVVKGPAINIIPPLLNCLNDITKCSTPNLTLEVKESPPVASSYTNSVTLNNTGGNIDLRWSNDAQGMASPLSCTLSSDKTTGPWSSPVLNDPGAGTDLARSIPQNNTTSSITTTLTITCTNGYHTIAPRSVMITVPGTIIPPTTQSISEVILEAEDPANPGFSTKSINFPNSLNSDKLNLRWKILYAYPNKPPLDVKCVGNTVNNTKSPWIKNGWEQKPAIDSTYVDTYYPSASGLNGTVQSPPNPNLFTLACYDLGDTNKKTVISNQIDVSFGSAPTTTLTISSATNIASGYSLTPTFVKLDPAGGTVNLNLSGSNINGGFCTVISSASGSAEDTAWKNIGSSINTYLSTNTIDPMSYSTASINVTKSTTFGINCTEAPPGIRSAPEGSWAQVQVQVGTIPPKPLTPVQPKIEFF